MAGRGGGLTPSDVVVIDDSTLYGHKVRDMVATVLGRGRGADDEAKCIAHQEAMAAPEAFWRSFSVALVDAYDAHVDGDATPVPVGDVVGRLRALGSPGRIIVYSANFDNSYFNRFVRDATDALAYYDAATLLEADARAMRSALLDDEPEFQANVPSSEDVGDIGQDGDLAKAVVAYQQDAQVWSWIRGITQWREIDGYRRRKVRAVAREVLKMSPPDRATKVRDGRVLTDRNPDHVDIRSVIRSALRLPTNRP